MKLQTRKSLQKVIFVLANIKIVAAGESYNFSSNTLMSATELLMYTQLRGVSSHYLRKLSTLKRGKSVSGGSMDGPIRRLEIECCLLCKRNCQSTTKPIKMLGK